MARRKSPPVSAPSNMAEATAILCRYSMILTAVEETRAVADVSIAAIEAERDAHNKPLEEEAKDLFVQLRSWWAVAGDAVTEGKRKSTEIAGCLLGVRTTTPMLKLPKGLNVDALIDRLLASWAGRLIIKRALNKPVILADLRNLDSVDPDLRAIYSLWGLEASQREEFFIDRALRAPAPADPEILEGETL
jgi:phage host-nuclease inhibitor protein Gam